ncbi:MAG: Uma2 family endonuclease [Chitinophagia bacterium]|nr:Uma2 family endonuclease [Chitinophagia bacterium]
MQFADLDLNRLYTYADYYKWQFEERVELIKGRIFKMSPAPNPLHQVLTGDLFTALNTFLKRKPCKVFIAPFDVRLSRQRADDHLVTTVLQPDICVVCDRSKIDGRGCLGAPDLVVEVLSPGNNAKELRNKYAAYEEAGVLEYWVVSPQNQTVIVYLLTDGQYKQEPIKVPGDILTTSILPGFALDLGELFGDTGLETE